MRQADGTLVVAGAAVVVAVVGGVVERQASTALTMG